MKKAILWVLGLGLLAFGGCLALTTAGIVSLGEDIEEAAALPGGSRETALNVGDTATVDSMEYVVSEVTTADTLTDSDGLFGELEPDGGGHFVLVTFSANNAGDGPGTIDAPVLEDDAGRRFTQTSVMDGYVPSGNNCTFEVMNPGMSQDCTTVFQVPGDAAGLMINFTTIGLSGGAWIDAGLE